MDSAHRARVAHGLPLNDYLGTGIAFKPHRANPADTWQYHLLLVESVPAGTEGTPRGAEFGQKHAPRHMGKAPPAIKNRANKNPLCLDGEPPHAHS